MLLCCCRVFTSSYQASDASLFRGLSGAEIELEQGVLESIIIAASSVPLTTPGRILVATGSFHSCESTPRPAPGWLYDGGDERRTDNPNQASIRCLFLPAAICCRQQGVLLASLSRDRARRNFETSVYLNPTREPQQPTISPAFTHHG